MKKQFLTAAAVLMSVYCHSQTKGTSALSLGISSSTQEYKTGTPDNSSIVKYKGSGLRLGYGLFVTDNNKVGIELLYNKSSNENQLPNQSRKEKGFGVGANFQHYFPIIKTLYAYAGASGQYMRTKGDENERSPFGRNSDGYTAFVGATGGLSWFISKRWALETNLISAGGSYRKNKLYQTVDNYSYMSKDSGFSLSTDGSINNLGFRVYLMF
jgi:hypothetical protein